MPGSPADSAGLKEGDVLVSLNEKPVALGKDSRKLFTENLKGAAKLGPVEFVVRRNASEQKFQVDPVDACDFETRLAYNSEKNAYADGKNIVINQGLMDFFKSDEEIYFMKLAGYKIDGAANFWRRMATADPKSITMKFSHPTSSERFVGIENVVQEIEGKIAAGEQLQPEFKNKQTAKADDKP